MSIISFLNVVLILLNLISCSMQQSIEDVDISIVDTPPLWVKVLSCTEGTGDADGESRFTYEYDESTMQRLASTANSIKIVPSNGELNPEYDHFAVFARPNTDPVTALNRFSEITSTVGLDENWIGTNSAKARLSQTATDSEARSFADYIYEGTDTEDSIRLAPATNDCQWDGATEHGQNIEVHFGYFTQILVTGCYGWDYASVSNSLRIQLKGSNGQSRFFIVNEYSSLPIHGRTASFYIGVDVGGVGDLHSVVLSVNDPYGYCVKELSVHTAHGGSYTFDSYSYFGTGIVLSDHCQYSYKSILPKSPLIRCIDDYFELYTHTMRGIYHVNMHTCVQREAGISAMAMEDSLYTVLMGKSNRELSYVTTDITYLDHYSVGQLHLDKLGHLIGANVFIHSEYHGGDAVYARDIDGTIIGIKIEAVGRYHMDESLGSRIKVQMDGKSVMFKSFMVLDDGKYLVMFLDDSDRVTVNMERSIQIDIYGADVMSNMHNVYVNIHVILDGYNDLYQLPFMTGYEEAGIDWFDANERCKSEYGTPLTSIHSKDESFLLEGFIGETKSWIGLVDFDLNGLMPYDRDYNDDWKWIDGSYVQFTNWISGDMSYHHDDGRDCAYVDGAKHGWDSEDCHQTDKLYLYTCASPYWYPDNHRKFEINVECQACVHDCIHDVTLISIGNDDADDALCIDSVSVDDEVSVDISANWIGGDSTESSMRVIFEYPVCETEVMDMYVDYSTSVSKLIKDVFTIPGQECYNGNRIIDSTCCIEQSYGLPVKTLYGLVRGGATQRKFSWASESKVTLTTTADASILTTNDFSFLSAFSMIYVDANGTSMNLKPHTVKPATSFHDTEQTNLTLGYSSFFTGNDPVYNSLYENTGTAAAKCQAEQEAPSSHSVDFSFQFNAFSYKVDVFSDLKLTLCDDFINTVEENDDSKFVYLRNVPGQIIHFEPITCNVRFDGVTYIPNSMTCEEEQQLAVSDGHKFLPRCKLDDTSLYDGCQCNLHDELCWCSDESGNMLPGQALKIYDDSTWEQTCVEKLNCADTYVTV